MSIYLSTSSDGNNTEGIGAMVQYQICIYALSKILNVKFAFFPFKNIQHFQYYNISQEHFCDDINKFFNFKTELKNNNYKIINTNLDNHFYQLLEKYKNTEEEIILNILHSNIINNNNNLLETIKEKKILLNLKNNLFLDDNKKYFNKDYFNVAFHIRKRTQTDCDDSPIREYFSNSSKEKIINLISEVNKRHSDKKLLFHIYSQGQESDFNFLNFKNIKFHIEEYPTISLYHMINSDALIMSNSSFSYICHFLGDSICYVRDNWNHKIYSKKKFTFNEKGFINE